MKNSLIIGNSFIAYRSDQDVLAPVWYENLSGVVSCPENSNIHTDGLDSVVIGSRDQ